jgi:multidrug resistance efflux pump
MPTRTHNRKDHIPVTAILAFTAALILAGAGIFTYFGGYWWQYWQQVRATKQQPPRTHWMTSTTDDTSRDVTDD